MAKNTYMCEPISHKFKSSHSRLNFFLVQEKVRVCYPTYGSRKSTSQHQFWFLAQLFWDVLLIFVFSYTFKKTSMCIKRRLEMFAFLTLQWSICGYPSPTKILFTLMECKSPKRKTLWMWMCTILWELSSLREQSLTNVLTLFYWEISSFWEHLLMYDSPMFNHESIILVKEGYNIRRELSAKLVHLNACITSYMNIKLGYKRAIQIQNS